MPVYDYTYKTYEGERESALTRWLAIPKFAYMDFLGFRMFIWWMTLAWMQFLGRLFYQYILVNPTILRAFQLSPSHLPPIGAFYFKNMIDVQIIFCFLFCVLMGGHLISRDMSHGALVLYASKPISRWEYFFGKFLTIFLLLMSLTWLQTMLLFVIQWLLSPENSDWRLYFWKDYAPLIAPITAYSTIISVGLSLAVLATASLTRNARYAGLTFGGVLIGAHILGGMMFQFIHSSGMVSPLWSAAELGYYLFGLTDRHLQLSQWQAWCGVLGFCGVCAGVLYWRLRRAIEVGR